MPSQRMLHCLMSFGITLPGSYPWLYVLMACQYDSGKPEQVHVLYCTSIGSDAHTILSKQQAARHIKAALVSSSQLKSVAIASQLWGADQGCLDDSGRVCVKLIPLAVLLSTDTGATCTLWESHAQHGRTQLGKSLAIHQHCSQHDFTW